MHYRSLFLGATSAAIAVAAGAFGAHALRARVAPELLVVFETGARYQMYHALALVALGLSNVVGRDPLFRMAGWLFLIGTLFFSGSLYALVLTDTRWWGAVTPFGGVAFLGGWG
jgi:uncharacterized membrane protein YgdD (TMEM256/DUF423 family)